MFANKMLQSSLPVEFLVKKCILKGILWFRTLSINCMSLAWLSIPLNVCQHQPHMHHLVQVLRHVSPQVPGSRRLRRRCFSRRVVISSESCETSVVPHKNQTEMTDVFSMRKATPTTPSSPNSTLLRSSPAAFETSA